MNVRPLLLVMVLGSLIVALGCARKEEQSAQSSSETTTLPGGEAPGTVPESEHGGSEAVNTTGSVAEIFARVHAQETELDQIITAGRLKEVHKKAFAIRDLVVAAAAQAQLSGVHKSALDDHVAKVKQVANALDEAGDSGDLTRTKGEYTSLQSELRGIEQLLGVAGR